jgi:alpha-glucoside transport system substrate-binding protein
MKKSIFFVLSLLMVAAMVLSACANAGEATQATTQEPATGGTTSEAKTYAAGQELTDAFAGKYKGKVVTMTGPFVDNDAVKFDNSVKDFEDKTGIDIQYSGTKEFEATIAIRVEGGDAPDIADFPQPGGLSSLVAKGYGVDLNKVIAADWLKQNYLQSWLDMGTMKGPNGPIMAGIWARVNGKSAVWYPKKEFDAAGYKIPQTWDELIALSDQIVKDGDTPWCVGIESGAATGWPMTDWIEEMMLRTTSVENYDKWVKGELKFDSPEVRKAIDVVSQIWFKDGYVYGGRKAIATTAFGDAPKPMFEKPPKCWLHKQGNFITTFFPEGLVAGEDYDFFYLPTVDEINGKNPVLVAGDIYAMFNDRPEVRAVIQYFTMGESLKGWVEAGGAISPHKDASLDWYKDPITKKVAEMIQNATAVRFDGSDLMPAAVGSGTFWKYMTDFVSGSTDLDTALKEIDASWPK